jgi:iron complex outermembrane receptor protein
MKKTRCMLFGLLTFAMFSFANAQQSTPSVVNLNIQPQPVDRAISAWAEQTGYQVLISADRASNNNITPAVQGSFTPEGALEVLLASTNLRYQFVNERTVAIRTEQADVPEETKPGVAHSDEGGRVPFESSPSSRNGVHQSSEPETVLVTAQKRVERLQDVPVPVTVISASSLLERNQLRIQDYYSTAPGLSLATDQFSGSPMLAIRGVTTGSGTNPTVGITVDDVPYGSSTSLGDGYVAPDIDPSDLASVEVLRGPQGTLYGASSIGGLLKFVTVAPSTDAVSGRVESGISGVHNGNKAGYNFRGAVNVPVSDTFAVRASGFVRREPGYVDNIQTGENAVNRTDAEGGRLSALWRPMEVFSVKLSALFQNIERRGSPLVEVGPGFADLQQSALPGTGKHHRKLQAYSATLNAALGVLDLTSVSGYNVTSVFYPTDLTSGFGLTTQSVLGVTGTVLEPHIRSNKFTQEVRLATRPGGRFDWLLGVFYTNENSRNVSNFAGVDPVTANTVGSEWYTIIPSTFDEYAAFADVTFHVTDRFNIQAGGRESWIRQTQDQTYSGALNNLFYGLPSPFEFPHLSVDENAFTYLVTPQFQLSQDLMVYARFASGYRAGGTNITATLSVPPTFNPDKTQNYEFGIKGNAFEHALSFDASVYYIDWRDLQTQVLNANFTGYLINAGRARSRGVELSAEARPVDGLSISAWVAWNDAELREVPPGNSVTAAPGDRLPFSSRFSGNFSADDQFSLTETLTGFAGGSVSYVGARKGIFQSIFAASPERQIFPSYVQLDLRAGVKSGLWTANLFATNVTDKRGVLSGGLGTFNPATFNYIQPRAVGLSLSRSF